MSDDLIRYDLLVQEALRGVVRKVLSAAARDGLPGEHYFHVEFLTKAPGVRLSERMRERFPDRMTIILQHHFWDLEVSEEALEVGLSFGGVGERVRVPFAAVTGFFDESVQFGLRFEIDEPRAQIDGAADESDLAQRQPKIDAQSDARRAEPDVKDAAREAGEGAAEDSPAEGAKVLSLNAFRKKS
jgi:hypothetical protein